MILSALELRNVYEALVLPMNHPDAIGYMTRALYMSGGDDEYYDGDGKVGFMPVDPRRAMELVGVQDVSALENNVSTTVLMDLMFYEQYGTIDDMMIAFHFGEESVSADGEYSGSLRRFLGDINSMRSSVREIVSPRRARLGDVIRMLKRQLEGKYHVDKGMMEVVEKMIEEN